MTSKFSSVIRRLFKVNKDSTGNLPPLPGIFPNKDAPVIRGNGDERELRLMRWGMPSSASVLFKAAQKRADKLEAKGKRVDFKELLRMEPDPEAPSTSALPYSPRQHRAVHWQPKS